MRFNVFTALTQVKELEAEKKNLLNKIEGLEKDLTEAQDVIGNFMVEKKTFDDTMNKIKAEHTAEIEKLTKDHQEKIRGLEEQLTKVDASTSQKASELVASMGVSQDELPVSTTSTNIVEDFQRLSGAEQRAFWVKHQNELSKLLYKGNKQ